MEIEASALRDVVKTIFSGLVFARVRELPSRAMRRVVEVRNVGLVLSPASHLSNLPLPNAIEVDRCRLAPGDVVITARGSEVRAAIATKEHEEAVLGPNLFAVRPGPALLPEVLAAFLRHQQTQARLLEKRLGSATPGFTLSQLATLPIEVPPLATQQVLASVVALADAYRLAVTQAAVHRQSVAADLVLEIMQPSGLRP
jgi:hypothetical protein